MAAFGLSRPGATVQNAVLFPLGLTSHRSPAASPLLGWLRLSAPPSRRSYSSERALATPSAPAVASSGGASTGADAVPASG